MLTLTVAHDYADAHPTTHHYRLFGVSLTNDMTAFTSSAMLMHVALRAAVTHFNCQKGLFQISSSPDFTGTLILPVLYCVVLSFFMLLLYTTRNGKIISAKKCSQPDWLRAG